MIDYTKYFDISEKTINLINKGELLAKDAFLKAEEVSQNNQLKVLKAFRDNKVSETHFIPSSGYGYDDAGKETLDRVYADIFGAEDAMVRHTITSGTHAISLCLFGVLRPGDTLVAVTGKPYDTLEETIGIRGEAGTGSLKDFGINYKEVPLKNGEVDFDGIKETIDDTVKAVIIQRSNGYDFRKTLSVSEIGDIISFVKNINSDIIAIVDNCYGEFVEEHEPTEVGADLMAGSLIKNPGGGIAPTGGYIAGKEKYVNMCAYKLNAVGIGKEAGATLGLTKQMFQGLFFAPHIVCQAVKTAILASAVFETSGFEVCPKYNEKRSCIIEAIKLQSEEALCLFCEGIQKGAAIDSFVTPTPCDMAGYEHKVIMAAGAFNQGSSIELSADGPIVEPFIAYMQGGLTYTYGKIGILFAVEKLVQKGIL